MATTVEYHANSNENSTSLMANRTKQSASGNKTDPTHCNNMMNIITKKRNRRCTGLPGLFERSSSKWWNPQMDSKILEDQCLNFSIEQSIWYFQLALIFIIVTSLSWIIYFAVRQQPDSWIAGIAWAAALLVICITTLFAATRRTYFFKKYGKYVAGVIAALLIVTVLVAASFHDVVMTGVGSFFLAAEVILLFYTALPLPLHFNFVMGIAFSIVYEIIYRVGLGEASAGDIFAHLFMHICLHIIGVQICLNVQVRRRTTYWTVGQIIKSNQSAEMEREFKKVMIDSIMPPSVLGRIVNGKKNGDEIFATTAKNEGKFRPLYVDRMENVSILYADIVGFTKMSTNKSAATLVCLLNDLFGRFDALCLSTGCEKISTLGDCYYCVAGCPDANPDHAKCCVEMGLGMISAIKEFCTANDLNVDMRIGIHTGIVICGIVGMKRFKFDVWSNDVSIANQMEQYGVPGRIHVSEATRKCLKDLYVVEEGKIEERASEETIKEKGLGTTYLIVKRNENPQQAKVKEICEEMPTKDQITLEDESVVVTQSNGVGAGDNGTHQSTSNGQDEIRVGTVNTDNIEQNNVNGTFDHESTMQTDPLLSEKNSASQQDVSKNRNGIRPETQMRQTQIFEFIGLIGLNTASQTAIREKQDQKFVDSIKDDPRMKNINNGKSMEPVSMRFKDAKIEEAYKNEFDSEVKNNEIITSFASSRFGFFIDFAISLIVFLLVFIASILSFGSQLENSAWLIYFCIFICLEVFVIYSVTSYVFNVKDVAAWIKSLMIQISGWIPSHFVGLIFLLCPAGMVFAHFWCRLTPPSCASFLIIMGVVIIHFLNFNQLNSWIRSLIASLVAVAILLLVYVNPCEEVSTTTGNITNITVHRLCLPEDVKYQYEFILDVLLLILFVCIVNREYEVGHRLTFFSAHEAEEKKMEEQRNTIDQLLHHIIPPRVFEVMREQTIYSQNHEDVGVIFASITNFNEFYEEAYEGGKECIRILNELIGDVDEILDKKEYADVEKIKTIGSTFMIASGLNPSIERSSNDHSHLVTLMNFCMEMQDVIYEFNENMVCFTFKLRIGFNHGSVTAGVIGTTKLLYDIWGDTVNIASRMDSTGENGKVQVSEASMKCMKHKFGFEHRGTTFVKGKGDMQTYLLQRDDGRQKQENAARTPKLFDLQIT